MDERQLVIESDGQAQEVCRAIKRHLAHGGSLPWPSISRAYQEWADTQEHLQAYYRGDLADEDHDAELNNVGALE